MRLLALVTFRRLILRERAAEAPLAVRASPIAAVSPLPFAAAIPSWTPQVDSPFAGLSADQSSSFAAFTGSSQLRLQQAKEDLAASVKELDQAGASVEVWCSLGFLGLGDWRRRFSCALSPLVVSRRVSRCCC